MIPGRGSAFPSWRSFYQPAKWAENSAQTRCNGFPKLGRIAEPGVYPAISEVPAQISRGHVLATAKGRAKLSRKGLDPNNLRPRNEALAQVADGLLKGQFEHSSGGGLLIDGVPTTVDPAY